MKMTLMQLMVAGVAMSAVLAIGHPASADEPDEAAWQSGVTLEDVAPPRVSLTHSARLVSRGAPASAGRAVDSAAVPVRFDSRGLHPSAGFLARDDGGAQDARTRAREARRRRIGLGALVGAGIGGTMGALLGANWCYNEGPGSCRLTFNFGALGALTGVGVGAALGALGDKIGRLPRPGPFPGRPPRQ